MVRACGFAARASSARSPCSIEAAPAFGAAPGVDAAHGHDAARGHDAAPGPGRRCSQDGAGGGGGATDAGSAAIGPTTVVQARTRQRVTRPAVTYGSARAKRSATSAVSP